MKKLIFGCCIWVLGACGQIDENIQVEIVVYDLEKVALQSNATISIYKSVEDWQHETSAVVPTQSTDQSGKTTFSGLKTGKYFLDIKKDDLDNWEGKKEIELKGNGGFSRFTVFFILESNRSRFISAAKGKKWQLQDFRRDNRSIYQQLPACEKDDIFFFEKGTKQGKLILNSSLLLCNTNEKNEVVGAWTLNTRGNVLSMETENFSETWNIVSLDKNTMVLQQIIFGTSLEKIYKNIP